MNTRRPKRRLLLLAVVAGLAVVLPACGRRVSKSVRLQREYNACCKEATGLLAGVTDVATARATEPRLKTLLKKWEKINDQLENSYDPENVSGRERDAMMHEVGQGIVEMQRLNAELFRIAKLPEVVAALGETWQELPSFPFMGAAGAIPPK